MGEYLNIETLQPPARSETDRVADLVAKYLQRHQPAGYKLVVNRQAIVKSGLRWLVQIDTENPTRVEIRADDVSDRILAANLDIDAELPRYVRLTSLVSQPGEVL
jgi:hypothetical protein